MSRGPVVYSLPPGTVPQAAGDTILSATWNTAMADIANTFNTAQPVEYGGTNATSAVGGADNLSPAYVNVASGSTTNIGTASSPNVNITGATTITAFDAAQAGAKRYVKFAGSLTLTYNATSLILPGSADIVTTAGDKAVFISLGAGNWECISYELASGPSPIKLQTVKATTSGTSVTFTSIPASVRRVTIAWAGVSTNGSSNLIFQLGDAGGYETSGYLGAGTSMAASVATTLFTNGFGVETSAAYIHHGSIKFDLIDPATNKWVANGVGSTSDAGRSYVISGSKSLTATLDRIRLTTAGGTDTFDAGAANISWEF